MDLWFKVGANAYTNAHREKLNAFLEMKKTPANSGIQSLIFAKVNVFIKAFINIFIKTYIIAFIKLMQYGYNALVCYKGFAIGAF